MDTARARAETRSSLPRCHFSFRPRGLNGSQRHRVGFINLVAATHEAKKMIKKRKSCASNVRRARTPGREPMKSATPADPTPLFNYLPTGCEHGTALSASPADTATLIARLNVRIYMCDAGWGDAFKNMLLYLSSFRKQTVERHSWKDSAPAFENKLRKRHRRPFQFLSAPAGASRPTIEREVRIIITALFASHGGARNYNARVNVVRVKRSPDR